MSELKRCLRCGNLPERFSDEKADTWLACVECGNKAIASNLRSDDYAFLRSENSWNSLMRKYEALDDRP